MAIVQAALQRHWRKKDKRDDRIDCLVAAQKVVMVDRIRYLGAKYISLHEITLEDKENLHDMHKAYRGLGGNGHLDTVMEEVDKIAVVDHYSV